MVTAPAPLIKKVAAYWKDYARKKKLERNAARCCAVFLVKNETVHV